MELNVKHYCGNDGLTTLKKEWDSLHRESIYPSFYTDWRWYAAMQKHLIREDMDFFAVYELETLIAILPLTRIKRRKYGLGITYLIFPYHQAVDLCDLVLRTGKAHLPVLQAVISFLTGKKPFHWDILELNSFSDRSGMHELTRAGSFEINEYGSSAYIARSAQQTMQDQLSKKQCKNVRALIKQATSRYHTVSQRQCMTSAEIPSAYETFLEIESLGWKGNEGTKSAIRLRPDAMAFYKKIMATFSADQQALINILDMNGQAVAAQMGLRVNNRLFLLKIGYDEAYKDVGPGSILLTMLIEKESNTCDEVNFVTNPPWAERWHFQTDTKWIYRNYHSNYAKVLHCVNQIINRLRHK